MQDPASTQNFTVNIIRIIQPPLVMVLFVLFLFTTMQKSHIVTGAKGTPLGPLAENCLIKEDLFVELFIFWKICQQLNAPKYPTSSFTTVSHWDCFQALLRVKIVWSEVSFYVVWRNEMLTPISVSRCW